eukprot:TRINITY_DN3268_c0_g1_i17.p1 TRINITY_DN3268_c0_g1~~TRINITY_DN3268_c0_g1_i17.p1  ORF type:complete len:207 (-),score=69.95 TRINITY_DN3268_c0_g1_i17:55-675(-)
MTSKKKSLIKIILIGDSGVGKTSLMQRFVANKFLSQYKATIGADFSSKDILIDDKSVTIQVWDTAGQERYQSLGVAFYKGAECCLLVYDITNAKSFNSLETWKSEFIKQASPKNPDTFPVIVLGNKADRDGERKVPFEKAKAWCEAHGKVPFFETSAKDQINVADAFEEAAKLALQNQKFAQPLIYLSHGPSQKLSASSSGKKGCC